MTKKRKIPRMLLNILIIIIAAAFFLGCLYFLQGNMIFFPRPLDENAEHILPFKNFETSFPSGGETLRGWLLNPGRERLIIYYGGNAEELSYCLEDFKDLDNCSVLMMNYRGFGRSTGKPGEAELFRDALEIFDRHKESYREIILVGRSIGSGVACHVAANREASKVILITPFDSLLSIARKCYPILPVSLLLKHRFDSLGCAPKSDEKCLFLVAGSDELIPAENSRRLYDKWAGEKKMIVIDGADHNSISGYGEFWEAMKDFIKD